MTYVIALPCVDVKDRACVEECPVDCIYEGARSLYIHPDECVDCGACEPVCPVEAIYYEDDFRTVGRPHRGQRAVLHRYPARLDLRWAARAGRPSSACYLPTPRWWPGFARTAMDGDGMRDRRQHVLDTI